MKIAHGTIQAYYPDKGYYQVYLPDPEDRTLSVVYSVNPGIRAPYTKGDKVLCVDASSAEHQAMWAIVGSLPVSHPPKSANAPESPEDFAAKQASSFASAILGSGDGTSPDFLGGEYPLRSGDAEVKATGGSVVRVFNFGGILTKASEHCFSFYSKLKNFMGFVCRSFRIQAIGTLIFSNNKMTGNTFFGIRVRNRTPVSPTEAISGNNFEFSTGVFPAASRSHALEEGTRVLLDGIHELYYSEGSLKGTMGNLIVDLSLPNMKDIATGDLSGVIKALFTKTELTLKEGILSISHGFNKVEMDMFSIEATSGIGNKVNMGLVSTEVEAGLGGLSLKSPTIITVEAPTVKLDAAVLGIGDFMLPTGSFSSIASAAGINPAAEAQEALAEKAEEEIMEQLLSPLEQAMEDLMEMAIAVATNKFKEWLEEQTKEGLDIIFNALRTLKTLLHLDTITAVLQQLSMASTAIQQLLTAFGITE